MATTSKVRVFISYARQQLYFAESLALNLRASGIEVWIDIQQLEPGSDWAEGIREGLESSTALILVASRQALDSPYVRQEWTAAIDAQKPVHIAFFQSVKLPAALSDSPQVSFFNFRRNFDRKLKQLSDCLKAGKVHRDAVDAWRFLAPPTAHWVVVASLLLPSLILITWLIAILAPGFGHFPQPFDNRDLQEIIASANLVVVWFYMIAVGIGSSISFWWRRFESFALRLLPWALVVWLWFAYRALDPVTHGQYAFRAHDVPLYMDQFPLIALGLTVLAFASFQLQRKSPDILRWMPLGQAPTNMRRAISERFVEGDSRPSLGRALQSGSTYQTFYSPADQAVAREVEAELRICGYKRIDAPSTQPASLVVFILSNHADLEDLKQSVGVLPKQVLAVVATSIQIPKSPEEIFRYQWLDYRRRTPAQLAQISQLLPGDDGANFRSSFAVDPESMERIVVPRGIFVVTNALRTLGGIVLGTGLYLLVLMGMGQGGSWRGIPILALGIAMFWLAGRLTQRRIGYWPFIVGYAILYLAMLLLGVSGVLWVLIRNYGIDAYTGQPTFWGYLYQAVLLLTPPATAFYYRELIGRWLPQDVKDGVPRISLQLRTPRIDWFVYSIYILGVLIITLALMAAARF